MLELVKDVPVCLALGYFDSVHLGHRSLIEKANNYAKSHGISTAVATFSNNAYKLFNKDGKSIYTYSERCNLLDGICDYVLPMRFDTALKNTDAKSFLDNLFLNYDIKSVVCGYDYLFGARAEGDVEFLKKYCSERNVKCLICDKFEFSGVRVSTSEIKDLLLQGKIETANAYLGEPFMLTGKVVHGRGAGRMFDIPTANVKLSADKFLPKEGVYGATCVVDDKKYRGAVNIGPRPTFDLSKTTVEIMIKDFNDDVYDKNITIYLHRFLRDVKKFETPVELSKQVHVDIEWGD